MKHDTGGLSFATSHLRSLHKSGIEFALCTQGGVRYGCLKRPEVASVRGEIS